MITYSCACGRYTSTECDATGAACPDCDQKVNATVKDRLTAARNVDRTVLIDLCDALRGCLKFVPVVNEAYTDALDAIEKAEETLGPSCASCGTYDVTTSIKTETFTYGYDPGVPLTVQIPVIKCDYCVMEFSDHRAEIIRDLAVQAHIASLR